MLNDSKSYHFNKIVYTISYKQTKNRKFDKEQITYIMDAIFI